MYLYLASLNSEGGPLAGTLLERLGMISLLFLFLSFWFYILSFFLLVRSARRENHDKPGMLFFTGCALQFGLLGFLILLMRYGHPFVIELVAFVVVVSPLCICLPPNCWDGYRQFRQSNPPARMQFFTTDLMIGVLYYGSLLATYLLVQDALMHAAAEWASWCDTDRAPTVWQLWAGGLWPTFVPSHIVTLEIALFLVVSISLFAALDVLRRVRRPLGVLTRSLAVLGILLYFTCTFMVGGLVAWLAWRTALNTVGLEEWRIRNPVATPVAAHGSGSGSG
jgi:hypothetical protein